MDKQIVIIGAGASGIAAATKLMENGFENLVVLEAESRIGGRVKTVPFGDCFIDMGAQWCHGEKDNVIFDLAMPLDVLARPAISTENHSHFIQSDGTILPESVNHQLTNLMSVFEVGNGDLLDSSYGDHVTNKYNSELLKEENKNLAGSSLEHDFLRTLERYDSIMNASDSLFDVSCRGYAELQDCEGEKLLDWKGNGYQTVFDLLTKQIPDPSKALPLESKLQLNKCVRVIRWSADSGRTVIECEDDSRFEADHLICTISVGVLQARQGTLFTPELPIMKRNAIEGLKLGTVNKIYIVFEEPFWVDDWSGFMVIWRDVELAELSGNPTENWVQSILAFSTVRYHRNVLCAWTGGALSREMETISEEDVKLAVTKWLRRLLKDKVIPEPLYIKRSCWNSEPNVLGSYSYQTVRSDVLGSSRSDLADPIMNVDNAPVLQFAGEATSLHHWGTVNGAVEAGWREAERIIDFHKFNMEKVTNIKSGSMYQVDPTTEYDVVILGAGLAGLGAALKLKKANMSFLLLEGQSKPGGRVNTMNLLTSKKSDGRERLSRNICDILDSSSSSIRGISDSPIFIDSGAQWLHGKCNNLHDVAERHDLLSDEQSEEGLGAFIRDDGVVLDEYLVKKTDFLVGEILTECEKYAHQQVTDSVNPRRNSTSYPKSVNRYLLDNFQTYLDGISDPDQRQQAEQLLDWHVRFQVIDNSCLTLDDVSAKSWGKYSYNGESCQAHYNFRKGFSSAADALVKEIGVDKCKFDMDVREVRFECDRVGADVATVRCANGSEFRSRHVICTFSMGSLKHGLDTQLFQPELPAKIVQTIRDIGFETINKLFLQFEHSWWGSLDGIQLVFNNDHYENWTRHISGFDVMRPGPKNTLLAWVGGHGALEMEKLSDKKIIQDCLDLLSQFTGLQVPNPIKYFCTRWHTNPFIRGAYSYISTSCDRNGTSSRLLAEPITRQDFESTRNTHNTNSLRIESHTPIAKQSLSSKQIDDFSSVHNETKTFQTQTTTDGRPLLLFAGEAVHDRYFSTAHGAFMSGMEQAAKIVDFYTTQNTAA